MVSYGSRTYSSLIFIPGPVSCQFRYVGIFNIIIG